MKTIPGDARFVLGVVDDLGGSAEVTRSLAAPEGGGITWATVLALIAAALFIGGFVGNLVRVQAPRAGPAVGVRHGPAPTRDGARKQDHRTLTGPDVYGLVADRAASDGGMSSSVSGIACLDLLRSDAYRPKLAEYVEIREFPLKWGNDYVMVANTRDLLHYRLARERSSRSCGRWTASRSVKELVLDEFEASGDLDPDAVTDLVRTLYEGNFLDQRYRDVDALVTRALDPVTERRRRARTFAKTLTIEWSDANRVVQWLYDHGLRYAFCKAVVAVEVFVAIVGVVIFVDAWSYPVTSRSGPVAGRELHRALAARLLLRLLHELGHALVVVRNGRRIKSAGFMIYFGSPAFFVDGSDGLMMDRRQQILSSFAGPFAEMILASAMRPHRLVVPRMVPGAHDVHRGRAELLPDPHEPDPAPRARRLLHPCRCDPGARPSPPIARVHARRSVPEDPASGALHQAGRRTRPVRDPRGRLHHLRSLQLLSVLEDPVRPARHAAVGRRDVHADPAHRPRGDRDRSGACGG